MRRPYTGRFAPSPSGPLHAGSLLAALASYLDARAHGGTWLLRIEDVDEPRTVAGADRCIMQQLRALGLYWDQTPVWQTQRHTQYAQAFGRLWQAQRVYPCHCPRKDLPPGPYPGTCRPPWADDPSAGQTRARSRDTPSTTQPSPACPVTPMREHTACSWRFRIRPGLMTGHDRWQGPWQQDVAQQVGDFIIRRTDGLWAYQLAVVVDDADQHVTDVVRGCDLLDSTPRQQQLQHALGLPVPRSLHVPLLCDTSGHKLSKQNHAQALDVRRPVACLQSAWRALGFPPLPHETTVCGFLTRATAAWARRFP